MKKRIWLISAGAALLIVLLCGALFLWKGCSAKPQEGSKAVVFELVQKDGTSRSYSLKTDAEYLADALVEEKLIAYDKEGLYTTIAGITADWSEAEGWWCFSKDGAALTNGINTQPIADGEHYEATYKNGY